LAILEKLNIFKIEQQTASMEEITSTAKKLGTLADKLKEGLNIIKIQESSERGVRKTI